MCNINSSRFPLKFVCEDRLPNGQVRFGRLRAEKVFGYVARVVLINCLSLLSNPSVRDLCHKSLV
jgi:hypothetical protein